MNKAHIKYKKVGKIQTNVTYLKMNSKPQNLIIPKIDTSIKLEEVKQIDISLYRELYHKVGEPLMWTGRKLISNEELEKTIHSQEITEGQGLLEKKLQDPTFSSSERRKVFEVLICSNLRFILQQFMGKNLEPSDLEDSIQDCIVDLLEHPEYFDASRANIRTFIEMRAKNLRTLKAKNTRKNKEFQTSKDDKMPDVEEEPEMDPLIHCEEMAELRGDIALLHEALKMLRSTSPKRHQSLIMYYGLSDEEPMKSPAIAKKLGVTKTCVTAYIRESIEKLYGMVAEMKLRELSRYQG